MTSTGFLIFSLAFVPAIIAAQVLWYVTRSRDISSGYYLDIPVAFVD